MWALGSARKCGDFRYRRVAWHYCGRIGLNAREQGSSHNIDLLGQRGAASEPGAGVTVGISLERAPLGKRDTCTRW